MRWFIRLFTTRLDMVNDIRVQAYELERIEQLVMDVHHKLASQIKQLEEKGNE